MQLADGRCIDCHVDHMKRRSEDCNVHMGIQPDQYTLDDDDPQSNAPDNCLHTGVTATQQPPRNGASTELHRSTRDRHPPDRLM